jgi:hypothetical protein
VTIRISFDPRSAAAMQKVIEQRAAFVVQRIGRQVANRAVQLAATAADNTYSDRAPDRRANIGSTRSGGGNAHYKNGFRGNVTSGGFPVNVTLSNRAQHAHILENGQSPHEIRGNPWLAFPKGSSATGNSILNAYGRPTARRTDDGANNTVVKRVFHPGAPGSHIMENALRQAWAEQGVRVGALRR